MAQRFYMMETANGRPALWNDIGSEINITGIVVSTGKDSRVLLLPGVPEPSVGMIEELTVEEWSEFIRRSDDPEILAGNPKIFQRKLRFQISGEVQQKIWAADGFKCMYCGIPMGQRLMTVDHFIPLELGGDNDTSNYLTACRKCNKKKGNKHPADFLEQHVVSALYEYLKRRSKSLASTG
jgi:hypothetical protein